MKIGIERSRSHSAILLRALNYIARSSYPTTLLLFTIPMWLIAASPASAQVGLSNVHPNLTRGSGKDKVSERYEWDGINLFNGNLNLSIPLGIRYPIAGQFGYQFALS